MKLYLLVRVWLAPAGRKFVHWCHPTISVPSPAWKWARYGSSECRYVNDVCNDVIPSYYVISLYFVSLGDILIIAIFPFV